MNPSDSTPSATPSHPPLPEPVARVSLGQRIGAYRLFWLLAFGVFIADQLTKLWIAHHLAFDRYGRPEGTIQVIKGFFNLVHVGNTGAAWSMFSGQSILLATLALATLAAIYFWRNALGLRAALSQVCFGLLCGGIVGNLLDRLMHGYVIDFIDLHFGTYIYPTFNVADSGICIGVILYLAQSLRGSK